MDLSWVEQAFWIFCIVAIIGSNWWAKKTRAQDARRADDNKTP